MSSLQVISVDFTFGDQHCQFRSTFSALDVPQATVIAVSLARASADLQATVTVNDVPLTIVLMNGVQLAYMPPELGNTTVSPINNHFINLLIEENCESFAYNNGMWRISGRFMFGESEVEMSSLFLSHKVPLAWVRSLAITSASDRFLSGSIVPPAHWTVNLHFLYTNLHYCIGFV
jgi:hypothetical protein